MRIVNKTNNSLIASQVLVAKSLSSRMKGLLGKKGLSNQEALIIERCNSVHTFFMRFPIDVVFVDKNNVVVETIACLKPFRISPIFWRAAFTIELPIGSIQSAGLKKGDNLLIE